MDTKKLFEYESNLESLKPQLSESEIMVTLKNPDSLKSEEAEQIASFTIAPGIDGLYVKFTDTDGNHQKLQFLNPIMAKSLAASLVQSLSMQGYIEDEILHEVATDAQTLH